MIKIVKIVHDRRNGKRSQPDASLRDADAGGTSRLRRPRAAGRRTASNAASTAQPRLVMIMINVRASAPAAGHPDPVTLPPSGWNWTAYSLRTSPLRGSRTKIAISATRREPESSRATWMTASSAEASCACNAGRGSPPERSQGLQTSGNVGSGIGVDRATPAIVAGMHRRQQVTDLGATDLADHQPVRTHAERLTDQISQADRSSQLGVSRPTLDSHDMRMVGRELPRILDDHDPVL
jgi:hypothetical protein